MGAEPIARAFWYHNENSPQDSNTQALPVIIFTDSHKARRQTVQNIVSKDTAMLINEHTNHIYDITLTPWHDGMLGNEKADFLARDMRIREPRIPHVEVCHRRKILIPLKLNTGEFPIPHLRLIRQQGP